jgi:hypothetical protein
MMENLKWNAGPTILALQLGDKLACLGGMEVSFGGAEAELIVIADQACDLCWGAVYLQENWGSDNRGHQRPVGYLL